MVLREEVGEALQIGLAEALVPRVRNVAVILSPASPFLVVS